MLLRLYLAMAVATAGLWATGCTAGQTDAASPWLTREMLALPFAGGDDVKQLRQSYDEAINLLKKRAVDEARDSDVEPLTVSYQAFQVDAHFVVGAITPAKGVFFLVPNRLYEAYGRNSPNGRVPQRKGKIDVCRFEVQWDKLPGGPFAPGINWAAPYMPGGVACEVPSAMQLAEGIGRLDRKSRIEHQIEGETSAGSIRVVLIREVTRQAIREEPARGPILFDAAAASTRLMAKGDRVVRAIPRFDEYDDIASVVFTRRGRLFAYIEPYGGSSYSDTKCATEGLSWDDLATKPDRPAMANAYRLCRDLLKPYRIRREEESRRMIEANPPRPPMATKRGN